MGTKRTLHKISIITIGLIILLLFSLTTIYPNYNKNENTVKGVSTWKQVTQMDFKNGTCENLTITPNGEVKLAHEMKFIEDDFLDESKIDYKKNLILNKSIDEIRLFRAFQNVNRTYGGILNDSARNINETSDGGFLITAITKSFGNGSYDGWVIKTDKLGNPQWNKTYGGYNSELYFYGFETSDGGYAFSGTTGSWGAGQKDVWIIKTNTLGNIVWNKTFGGSDTDHCYRMEQTDDGGYILIGDTWSYGVGDCNVWLIKLNSTGHKKWDRMFGHKYSTGKSGITHGLSVLQTSDGGYILTSYTDHFNPTLFDWDYWIIKTNSTGYMEWNASFGGSNKDFADMAIETADNGFLIFGETFSSGMDDSDIWLIKINKTGAKQWDKKYGGSNLDYFNKILKINDSNYLIIGSTKSYTNTEVDLWIIKINNTGHELWNTTYGGSGEDWAYSAELTSTGNLAILSTTNSFGAGKYDVWLLISDELTNLTLESKGSLTSSNLLNDNEVTIKQFNCSANIPNNASLTIQFSRDKIQWYNSLGIQNDYDTLTNGYNSIDLSNLIWSGNEFYYRADFSSNSKEILSLQNINLSYFQYFSTGYLESLAFNINDDISWRTLNWTSIEPDRTEIRVRLRTGESQTELYTKNYIGPDGLETSFYLKTATDIWNGHNGDNWIQYKAYFITQNTSQTPVLKNITISYNYWPMAPILNKPINNYITNEGKLSFSWTFNDIDSISQIEFQWQMDDSIDFNSIDYDSGEIPSTSTSFTPPYIIPEGSWYWRVRTKDSDGDWGQFSNYSNLMIDTTILKPIEVTVNPSTWTSNNSFIIDWTNPADIAGIKTGTFYYLGKDPPESQNDGIWISKKPFNITNTHEGENYIYLWLEDNVGNKNCLNYTSTILKLDKTKPINLSLIINENAQYTNSNIVNLNVSAIDLLSGINNMSFSFNEIEWTEWEPYTQVKSIDLPYGDGTKTINFRINDNAGNIAQTSNSIILDTMPPYSLSLSINDGAFQTNNTTVNLKLNAIDLLSGVDQMSFSTDYNTWTPWEKFTKTKLFNLEPNDGKKAIYFRVRDYAGNIANPIYSAIILNTSSPEIKPINGEKPNGSEPEENETKKPTDKGDDDSTWIIIGVTIIIISVILIIIFFLIIKRKKKEKIESKTQSDSNAEKETQQQLSQQPQQKLTQPQQTQIQPTIQPQQKNCSTCGSSLKYYQQNNKYYCYRCKKYE